MDIMIFLDEVSASILACEKSGKKNLAEGKNEGYLADMHKKARTLADLSMNIKKCDISGLSANALQFISESIDSFSASAKKSIELKSPWFMSQLLFNEDYKEGDLNNFELFLQEAKEIN